jgi:hypothetical protein
MSSCLPCGSEAELIGQDVELLGCSLPPLPPPDRKSLRAEKCGGGSLVGCLITTFVTLTLVFTMGTPKATFIPIAVVVVTEAAIAIFCLGWIQHGDPGIVQRSRKSCTPVPPEVVEKLSAERSDTGVGLHPLAGMVNIKEQDRSYCVRCCLWREETPERAWYSCMYPVGAVAPKPVQVHHCSTCQRCVRHFDHHCGVLGRCIAGKLIPTCRESVGNMPCFALLICMGYAGAVTTVIAAVVGLQHGLSDRLDVDGWFNSSAATE